MASVDQAGDPEELTVDLRAAQQSGRLPAVPGPVAGQRAPAADADAATAADAPDAAPPGVPTAVLEQVLAQRVPTRVTPAAAGEVRRVSGKVYDELGVPVPELELLVYHIGFGCDGVRLAAARTGGDGSYDVEYGHPGVVNLQLRAAEGREGEAVLSRIKYRAGAHEVLNLVCPEQVRPAASEHARLLADLAGHLGRADLADAAEDADGCRDITLLSQAAGWDGRVVALAARAEQLARETGVPGGVLYALLRTGLPADARQLSALAPATLDRAFGRARAARLADVSPEQAEQAKARLAEHARTLRLDSTAAAGTLSTVGELLATSGLSDDEARRFDEIAAGHTGTGPELWERAAQAGIPARKIAELQTQGKLAQLTLNNAPLIAALRADVGEDGLGRAFMRLDLHTADAWREYLTGRARGEVDALVPPAYSGDTAEERLSVYAEDLARKVRLGLPTHVVARRVEQGELRVPAAARVAQVVYQAADEHGFRFGQTPTRTFLKQHPELLDGLPEPVTVERSLNTLHRVYQITPSDEAMTVLLAKGVTSAHQVTALSQDRFVQSVTTELSPAIAELIYRKAALVSSVAYSAFAAAQQLASTPVVYAVSPPAEVAQAAQDNLVKHFPTMENLFGSLDFCECDHCRSVLSPAAYLVDLLSFTDPDDGVWELLRDAPAEPKPFQVLTQRRPDLPQLPLTCENTHTVLPYIDVVNEILEFSAAHGGDTLPAFDVGTADSDDLLAEPQYLITEAYPLLRDAVYPLGLPFDLWLETVRGFLDRLDAPLPLVLDRLCPTEALDGAPYGRRDVLREQLGLSPAEYALFTAGTADWHRLYGYPDAPAARAALAKAKTLARRLDVSYKDLAELVTTWFVNPDLDALVLLRSLDLTPYDLMRYMGAAQVPAFDPAEKASFEAKAGTHLAGLTTAYAFGSYDRIVVLSDSDTSASFENTTLRYLGSADPLDEVLTRLNLLVRLRDRLGWSTAETDAALRAFLPAGPVGPALTTALISLAHHRTLAGQLKLGADTRIALLSLWSRMDTARYRRLFLSPRMREADREVFDDPHGQYLADPALLLKDHLRAVQGALALTADDIRLILGGGFDTAVLSMDVVSLLDRHRLLAKGLKLSIADLLALKDLSGVDPFRPTGAPIAVAADDAAWGTVRFAELAGVLKQAGLKVAELDLLVRGGYDPAGPLRPEPVRVLGLIRALAGEIERIRAEHAAPADALAFTDDVIGQKLPLVLPLPTATTFLGMWSGTLPPDQAFFDTHLLAPVGFAAPGDYAVLFGPAPAGDGEARETWDRGRRAHLAGLFLPFLRDRLIRAAATALLTDEFGAAPELMRPLLTELLALDGGPLLPVFTTAATAGFTVSYLDAAGAELGTLLSATGSAPAGPAGTSSVRLSAVVEVPTPGPYAFSAGPGASLRLGHLTDPLAAHPDGAFDPVGLEAATLYELTATVPGAGPVQLAVTAENLPEGPAGRLTARPGATVARIGAAYEQVRRALLLAGALELGPAELRHLHERAADFDGWDLSVPTFAAVLRACRLVLLREQWRADGADLVAVLREARRTPEPGETPDTVRAGVLARLAVLTRRTPEVVADAADVLGLDDPEDLADERGLTRLWGLLSLAAALGVPPSSAAAWADPQPDEALAADVRTTLKARFERSAWRATVRPVSDRLRQRRRDALVAYLRHRDGYASVEQMFEHFLIDPGTEPVVQTSRLRLAISSVQTFVQRCLMNLEPEVRPAVLSSTQWAWMKRYRVWEANRKIFLWPENWLEPEFRDDKTHLFQALEGELLQGDVSADLAEDAFGRYLSGLDRIARLEIVSTWLHEHETDPAHNTLHVIGRTFNKPQEYFYRRYQHQAWTPWEPVAAQIESDHVVVTMWRGRPYLFWLTFLDRAEAPSGDIDYSGDARPTKIVDVQVSWAEYVNGQWAPAEASDLNRPLSATVPADFDRRKVFVHAAVYLTEEDDRVTIYLSKGGSKAQAAQEGNGVGFSTPITGLDRVMLEFTLFGKPTVYRGFRLVGRNAPVQITSSGSSPKAPPFSWTEVRGTRYHHSGPLTVWYTSRIEKANGKTTEQKSAKQVLAKGGGYSLVIPPAPVATAAGPEIDGLVRPFFYQDDAHTFYVEPTVTERVFHEWDDWIVVEPAGPKFDFDLDDDLYWEELHFDPIGPVVNPDPISPLAVYAVRELSTTADAVLAVHTGVVFGDTVITAGGAIHGQRQQ